MMHELQDKRIFMTGGTGVFGKWLLNSMFDVEAEVVLLTRSAERFTSAFPMDGTKLKISYVEGDIRDFTMPGGRFDYLIHAATPVTSDQLGADTAEMYSIIEEGTRGFLDKVSGSGASRLLYVSSGAVYGTQPTDVDNVSETQVCRPAMEYGRGKLDAERLCAASGIPSVSARCFAFTGPHFPLNGSFAVGNFIKNCLNKEPIIIQGDGTPRRSYMYSTDLAEWLLRILLSGHAGEAYNVGSGVSTSIHDLALLVREIAGTDNEIQIKQTPDPAVPPPRYVPCVAKAETDLGLTIKVGLEDAIARTIQWYRERAAAQ